MYCGLRVGTSPTLGARERCQKEFSGAHSGLSAAYAADCSVFNEPVGQVDTSDGFFISIFSVHSIPTIHVQLWKRAVF